jgi:hypothetical protein
MYSVTNKKYQKIKIFVNQHESVDVQPKETIMINVPNISEHMKDLQESGFIKIKKVEK